MSVTREDIVMYARGFLDTPWQHQGRSEHGIDCVGLLTRTASALGLSSFDLTDYARAPAGNELIEVLDSQMPRIHPKEAFGLGDALVFHDNGSPTHVGIVGDYAHGGWSLIHAFNQAKPKPRVIEHRLDDLLWMPRLVAAYRLIEAYR